MEKKNEVAAAGTFNLQTLSGELAQAIAEEMDGLGTIPYDRVKIPSGGGLAFEVPGEDEDSPDAEKELTGVILYHHPVNAYWQDKFSGGNEAPDCSSMDGKTGRNRNTGECRSCADCPYNKFADDGSGKPCKNMHRIYFLREGNPVPLLITLPPTSLKFLRDYIGKRVLLKGLRCFEVITKISLKKEQSKDGIAYSRAVFTLADRLSEEQAAATREMAEGLKERNADIEVDDGDYTTAKPSTDGFTEVPEDIAEELPFK